MRLKIKYLFIGIMIGMCLNATFSWAYQMITLVDGNGNGWGSSSSPITIKGV